MEAESKKLGFKKQLTKEEKAEKKKLRLAAIGESRIRYVDYDPGLMTYGKTWICLRRILDK